MGRVSPKTPHPGESWAAVANPVTWGLSHRNPCPPVLQTRSLIQASRGPFGGPRHRPSCLLQLRAASSAPFGVLGSQSRISSPRLHVAGLSARPSLPAAVFSSEHESHWTDEAPSCGVTAASPRPPATALLPGTGTWEARAGYTVGAGRELTVRKGASGLGEGFRAGTCGGDTWQRPPAGRRGRAGPGHTGLQRGGEQGAGWAPWRGPATPTLLGSDRTGDGGHGPVPRAHAGPCGGTSKEAGGCPLPGPPCPRPRELWQEVAQGTKTEN